MIRKEGKRCPVTIDEPHTAFKAVLDGNDGEILDVAAVKFRCAKGYTTDGAGPTDANTDFTVNCADSHRGCLPHPCTHALVPLTQKFVTATPSVDEARVGDTVTFAAAPWPKFSFDGKSTAPEQRERELTCTGTGWVDASGDAATVIEAFAVECDTISAELAADMNINELADTPVKLDQPLAVTCVTGYAFGYSNEATACGDADCPGILEQARELTCEAGTEAFDPATNFVAAFATDGVECTKVQCHVPHEAHLHGTGAPSAVVAYGETFSVQCDDTARPAGDADDANAAFTASCLEHGIRPPVGWCASVECEAWQGSEGHEKGHAEAFRTEVCPDGESVSGGDRREPGNDGEHVYQCKKDARHRFEWHCIRGANCEEGPLREHEESDVKQECKPVMCPLPEVGDHASKLLWMDGGGAEISGEVRFGTRLHAACKLGYDLKYVTSDGSVRWPELEEVANSLRADLGPCNDHAQLTALEDKGGRALTCEPTVAYCAELGAEELAEVGVLSKGLPPKPRKRTYLEAARGVEAATEAGAGGGAVPAARLGEEREVSCLEGYRFSTLYDVLSLHDTVRVACTAATPAAGSFLPSMPALQGSFGPLGGESICEPIVCDVPEKHANGAVAVGGGTLQFGEKAHYRCPKGMVMAEVGQTQRLVPEEVQENFAFGSCTETYVTDGELTWAVSKRGSGLPTWGCFADCGSVSEHLELDRLGLRWESAHDGVDEKKAAVTHYIPKNTERRQKLMEKNGYGTLNFVTGSCFDSQNRKAALTCGESGDWMVTLGGSKDKTKLADLAQGSRFLSEAAIQKLGVQLHVLDAQHQKGTTCLEAAEDGDALRVAECDPLSVAQRFDYPDANYNADAYTEKPGLIVSALHGKCVHLTGSERHTRTKENVFGMASGRPGELILASCEGLCDVGREERVCDRGALKAEELPAMNWGPDPDCPFFVWMGRPAGTASEFYANFEHPCINAPADGKECRRARTAGMGAVGLVAEQEEGVSVLVNYRHRPGETRALLVE